MSVFTKPNVLTPYNILCIIRIQNYILQYVNTRYDLY